MIPTDILVGSIYAFVLAMALYKHWRGPRPDKWGKDWL